LSGQQGALKKASVKKRGKSNNLTERKKNLGGEGGRANSEWNKI